MEITGVKIKTNNTYKGPWLPALIDHTKINGVWKDISSIWTKINGEWVSDLKDITFVEGSTSEEIKIGDFVYSDYTYSSELHLARGVVGFVVDIIDTKCKIFSCKRANPVDTNIAWGNFISDLPVNSGSRPIARADMNGRANTDVILSVKTTDNPQPNVLTDYPAANYCNNFSVKGFSKGSWYLPSCGECLKVAQVWSTIKQILVENGLDIPKQQYIWTSTGYASDAAPAWIYDLNNITNGENSGHNTNKYGTYDVFPMTCIDLSTISKEVVVTINNKEIVGKMPLTVKGRLNHTYTYKISKEGFTDIEGNVLVNENKTIEVIFGEGLLIGEVQRYTTNTTFTIPSQARSMDVFLVGGGGGGGSWNTWSYVNGMGGNGGHIVSENVKVTPGDVWQVQIGAGGKKSTTKTPLAKSATDGGSTKLICGDTVIIAEGGRGGVNSVHQNTLPPNEFIKQHGEYVIYVGKDGTEYYQGPVAASALNSKSISDGRGIKIVDNVDNLPTYNSTANSKKLEGLGIPEFLEQGNPTHAICAPTSRNIACTATYGPEPTFIKTDYGNNKWGTYSGGGYGAGGNAGDYYGPSIAFGGNGRSGIVCVRFRR